MACEDFPCCGHEAGCCPDFDESGRQLNMVCTCGAKLPIDSRYSICETCINCNEDDDAQLARDMIRDEQYEDESGEDDIDAADGEQYDEPHDMTDVEADADTLASAGYGTDEDYGFFGDE